MCKKNGAKSKQGACSADLIAKGLPREVVRKAAKELEQAEVVLHGLVHQG